MEPSTTAVQSHLDRLAKWATEQDAILALYLYGSQMTGHANALSDIDVGVLVRPDFPKDDLWRKELAWAGQWGAPIDLCVLNLAPLAFQYEVTAQGRRLWAADVDEAAAQESPIWRRYWDMHPRFEEYWAVHVRQKQISLPDARDLFITYCIRPSSLLYVALQTDHVLRWARSCATVKSGAR